MKWAKGPARLLAGLAVWGVAAFSQAFEPELGQSRLTVLAYHDVVDRRTAETQPDAVTVQELGQQLQWLRTEGYRFVSAQDVLDARAGKAQLPKKPVLLTFDDGYSSFYTHAFPLLQAYQAPSVLAVVGVWQGGISPVPVLVDGVRVPASRFLSRAQLQTLAASGLVEVASHSHDLHRGLLASPQGSRIPAAIAREYDPVHQRYESDAAYDRRLREDLSASAEQIAEVTGRRPRLLVWPYGRYNGRSLAAARDSGYLLTLGLDEAPSEATGAVELPLGRKYVSEGLTLTDFSRFVRAGARAPRTYRHFAVRLDSGDSNDESRIAALIGTARRSGANTVLLNPFSRGCKAYFAGAREVERDLLTRAVWQLHQRAGVHVFLDLDVQGCMRAETAQQEVRLMSQLASFDGLALRADPGATALAGALAQVFLAEHPGRPVVSNADIPQRTWALRSIDACGIGSDKQTAVASHDVARAAVWVEGVARDCAALSILETEVRAGAGSWGVRLESGRSENSMLENAGSPWLARHVRPLLSGQLLQLVGD